MKENEMIRLKEFSNMREIFKKLIYSLEQQYLARPGQAGGNKDGSMPPSAYGNKRINRGQLSVADKNFGASLPNVNQIDGS